MPIVSAKPDLNSWEKWQEHLEKRFKKKEDCKVQEKQKVEDAQEAQQEQKPEDTQEQELYLEFLEKPIE